MAFGDIMKNLGLGPGGTPSQSGELASQLLLEQRNKPTRGIANGFGRALSISLGMKMASNLSRAAEEERTKEQEAIAVAMGVNPLAYEAERTLKSMDKANTRANQSHELAGEAAAASSVMKSTMGLMGPLAAAGRAVEGVGSAAQGAAERARTEAGTKKIEYNDMMYRQNEKKRSSIQRLIGSRDPKMQQLGMQLSQEGKPQWKVIGDKFLETVRGKPTGNVIDTGDPETEVLKPGEVWKDKNGKLLAKGAEKEDDLKTWLKEGKNPLTGEPQHVIIGEDGSTIWTGAEVPEKVSTVITKDGSVLTGDKTTARSIFSDIVGVEDTIARVDKILDGFDPDYFTYAKQGKEGLKSYALKAGVPLSDDAKEAAFEYRYFQGDLQGFVNSYIKEITGAQMGEKEAERIMKALGSFKDDSVSFEAKMKAMRDGMLASRDRYERQMLMIDPGWSEARREKAEIAAKNGAEQAFAQAVEMAEVEYQIYGEYEGRGADTGPPKDGATW